MSSATLSDTFATADPEKWRQGLARLESSPAFEGLAATIAGQTDMMGWSATLQEIGKKVPDLLRIDVRNVLVGGWKKSEELRRYTDPEQYPPDETILVELIQHSIRSSHAPHLDFLIRNTQVGRIEFELDMKIDVDGAVLTIRDGKIWALSVGACVASGELTCEGHSILEKKSEPIELPGTYELAQPVQIAPPPTAQSETTEQDATDPQYPEGKQYTW